MTILQLDTKIKDEGIIHQFMKKSLWAAIQNKGINFCLDNSHINRVDILIKKKDPYLEIEKFLNGILIKPDISTLDNNGNLETVIECIHTSRPSLLKYRAYMNSNINIIFIHSDESVASFEEGHSINASLIIKKDDSEQHRYKELIKHLAKINDNKQPNDGIFNIGRFENEDNYFIFNLRKESRKPVQFLSSTQYSAGNFHVSNSKKIPPLLKTYVEKFETPPEKEPKYWTYAKGRVVHEDIEKWIPREDWMMGLRPNKVKKVIEYWRL